MTTTTELKRSRLGVSRVPRAPRSAASSNVVVGGAPLSIPKSQEYLWTRHWLAGEEESEADIGAGRVMRFKSPSEALAWLESDED